MFLSVISAAFLSFKQKAFAHMATIEPEKLHFKGDVQIPNSKYPLLLYKNSFADRGDMGADWLEKEFASNNWTNS